MDFRKLMKEINGSNLTIEDVYNVAHNNNPVEISPGSIDKIQKSRQQFEEIIDNGTPVYGVTTGYGDMIYVLIDKEKETELQHNLVKSHAAGVGSNFLKEEARAILLARINSLARGHSAVTKKLVDRLVFYLNNDIIPVIPEIGSLGASGDLAPLAHVAATLIGEGYVFDSNHKPVPSKKILQKFALEPLTLKFKEGLAAINGTSAMTGLGSLVLFKAYEQVRQAEIITVLALENQKASGSPFLAEGHEIAKPHKGQIDCASNLRKLMEGSQLISSHQELRENLFSQKKGSVTSTNIYLQKAYSLRCIPQVLGAVRDTIYHANNVVTTELNSSNDNPLFFEGKEVFHGANFHGQPVAFVMDFLSISLTQLGVLSERRTNRLLNRFLNGGMPEFLIKKDPGLNCGFAGAQYPATALVAENRVICSPASIQSVPSNADNQDVVSMGLISARNARKILQNNYYILAVELMSAAQAIDVANQYTLLSKQSKKVYDIVRSVIPTLESDRYMSDDIYKIADLIKDGKILKEINLIADIF